MNTLPPTGTAVDLNGDGTGNDHTHRHVAFAPPPGANETKSEDSYGDVILDRTGVYRPALGPAWFHCVTSRIVMSTSVHRDITTGDVFRQMHLVKSPVSGNVSLAFDIGEGGVMAT